MSLAAAQPQNRRASDGRHNIRNYVLFASATLVAIIGASLSIRTPSSSARVAADAGTACQPKAGPVPLPEISEASGVAASRRTPGLAWTHNDQGKPTLYALDESGTVRGRVAVAGAALEDWEDVAAARCGSEDCLYLADIGDNGARRRQVSVYRVREPAPTDAATQPAEAFHATYPDGAHDAEALVVAGDRIVIVTKGAGGQIAAYRFPQPLQPGSTVQLEKLGTLADRKSAKGIRVTGGATSPDGARIALRTHDAVFVYDAAAFLAGRFDSPQRFDLAPMREPQGEGVAFDRDGSLLLASEGGGKGRPGQLARAACGGPGPSAN